MNLLKKYKWLIIFISITTSWFLRITTVSPRINHILFLTWILITVGYVFKGKYPKNFFTIILAIPVLLISMLASLSWLLSGYFALTRNVDYSFELMMERQSIVNKNKFFKAYRTNSGAWS